jgi:hypothetical protein
MQRFKILMGAITLSLCGVALASDDGNFAVHYANLTGGNDVVVNLSNTGNVTQPLPTSTDPTPPAITPVGPGGLQGAISMRRAPLALGGGDGTNLNLCANVYVFSPDEQEVACCSCVVSANSLHSYDAKFDLVGNTLTNVPVTSAVIKIVATVPTAAFPNCNAGTAGLLDNKGNPLGQPLTGGLVAWARNTVLTGESAFITSNVTKAELARVTGLCKNIQDNGSGAGICFGCHLGGI